MALSNNLELLWQHSFFFFFFFSIMLMKEGGALIEPISHAFIYVSLYKSQKGTSIARFKMGRKAYFIRIISELEEITVKEQRWLEAARVLHNGEELYCGDLTPVVYTEHLKYEHEYNNILHVIRFDELIQMVEAKTKPPKRRRVSSSPRRSRSSASAASGENGTTGASSSTTPAAASNSIPETQTDINRALVQLITRHLDELKTDPTSDSNCSTDN
ncbi:hypothetical protein LguiA_032284 [Lonicera macranthoides]